MNHTSKTSIDVEEAKPHSNYGNTIASDMSLVTRCNQNQNENSNSNVDGNHPLHHHLHHCQDLDSSFDTNYERLVGSEHVENMPILDNLHHLHDDPISSTFLRTNNNVRHVCDDPIVVAYAFGPKKMKSMGLVLAEASRVHVIHEEEQEVILPVAKIDSDNYTLRQSLDVAKMQNGEMLIESLHPTQPCHLYQQQHQQQQQQQQGLLTQAALHEMEHNTSQQQSTIITLGNSNDTDLKNIVRYFRSSCSSAASMGETTVSTPTTITTTTSTIRSNQSATIGSHFQQRFSTSSTVRISFVPVDTDLPLEEQHGGHFDLLLHKLTEDILCCSLHDNHHHEDQINGKHVETQTSQMEKNTVSAARQRIQALKSYSDMHPSCCLIDDPANVQTLMSRSDIAQVLQSCLQNVKSTSGIPVRSPKFVVARDTTRPEALQFISQQLQDQGLSPPFIVKPLIAAGTKQSHFMKIFLQHSHGDALSSLKRNLPDRTIIQEYVNHDAVLFKVYVLGEHVYVYQRNSLPDLPDPLETSLEVLQFDSQRPYPSLQDFGIAMSPDEAIIDTTSSHGDANDEKFSPKALSSPSLSASVTAEEVEPIVRCLRQAFGLELFGFDILRSSSSSSSSEGLPKDEYLVVDVNYFPSYKEVPDFPSLLAHYLTQRVLKKRRIQR